MMKNYKFQNKITQLKHLIIKFLKKDKFYFLFIKRIYLLTCKPFLTIVILIIDLKKKQLITKPPDNDHSKKKFLLTLNPNSKILDVGCGNNSPLLTKKIVPNCFYIGIDIQDYNQETYESIKSADEYHIVKPDDFDKKILDFQSQIDVVISSHNLEHCYERRKVLANMIKTLKKGGKIYLEFPTYSSTSFPGYRDGCLNYYDDKTHMYLPPDFGEVISILNKENCKIIYANTNYQDVIGWLFGLFNENSSFKTKEVREGTWSLWGFQTIVWAEKMF